MTTEHATVRLGNYLARTVSTPLAPEVATKAAICLLDALGLAFIGASEPTAAAARSLAPRRNPGRDAARIWVDGSHAGLTDAAMTNGISVHAIFQDDSEHDSWAHPGSLVTPAVIAVAESRGASLDTVLKSIVAGYSTLQWLGAKEAVANGLIGRGLRPSANLGAIGAAAAASVALGLDAEKAQSAVAIAVSTTGGTREPVRCGSEEWRVQNGRATQGGLFAALMAEQGVRGAPSALDGPLGLLHSLAGIDELPDNWKEDPDPAMMAEIMAKPFVTLGHNVGAALAALVARDRNPDLDKIKSIAIEIWKSYASHATTATKGPFESPVQCLASSGFAVSAMLMFGDLTYDMALNERDNAKLGALIQKTSVVPGDRTASDARITIEFEDGSTMECDSDEAPRNMIFQDEARATEVLEKRLTTCGKPAGAGIALAERIFASVGRGGSDLPIAAVLDGLEGR